MRETDCMCQEKKEGEDFLAFKVASSPVDLRTLVVAQTLLENHLLTLSWKILKREKNDNHTKMNSKP